MSMSIQFPRNRKEVVDRAKADMQSQLPETNPFLKNSYLGALITSCAGRVYEFYLQMKNALLMMFPDTATGAYLERWGSYVNINRNAATQATGYVNFTGTLTTVIPSGTLLSDSEGNTYTTTSAGAITAMSAGVSSLTRSGDTATVTTTGTHSFATGQEVTIAGATPSAYNGTWTIVATSTTSFTFTITGSPSTPASGTITASTNMSNIPVRSSVYGQVANQDSGTELTLNTPIAGIDNITLVQYSGLSGGTDVESDADYRERVLYRYQNPIALFNESAILSQVFKVAGVTRAWVRGAGYTYGAVTVSSLTSSGLIATVTTSSNHYLENGQLVTIAGATPSGYNITTRILVTTPTTFIYPLSGALSSPATGTITFARGVPAGQVLIFFMRDNDTSPIPDYGEVVDVYNKVLEIKPAHVYPSDVGVQAPVAVPTNFTFTALSPNTTTMQEAITAALTEAFKTQTEPQVNVPSAMYTAAIWQAVSEAGETVVSYSLSAPSGTISVGTNGIATLGTITYP